MESSPYRDDQPTPSNESGGGPFVVKTEQGAPDATGGGEGAGPSESGGGGGGGGEMNTGGQQQPRHQHRPQHNERNNGRRGRRGRGRGGPRPDQQQNQNQQHVPSGPPVPIVADGATVGWFDAGRDGGYIRRAAESYLPTPTTRSFRCMWCGSSRCAAAT